MNNYYRHRSLHVGFAICFGVLAVLPLSMSAFARPTVSPSIVQANSAERQTRVERFFNLLFVQKQYGEAARLITPTLRQEFSPSLLEQKSQNFQNNVGRFIKILDIEVDNEVAVVETEFEQSTVTFVVSFDDRSMIASVNPVLDFLGNISP